MSEDKRDHWGVAHGCYEDDRERVAEIRQYIAAARERLDGSHGSLMRHERDLDLLLRALDAATARADEAERERDEANRKVGSVLAKLSSTEVRLERERDEARAALATESAERLRCRDGWALAAQECDALRASVERLRGDFACSADQARRLDASVERLTAENERLKAELAAITCGTASGEILRGDIVYSRGYRAGREEAEGAISRLRAAGDALRAGCVTAAGPGDRHQRCRLCDTTMRHLQHEPGCPVEAWDRARGGT